MVSADELIRMMDNGASDQEIADQFTKVLNEALSEKRKRDDKAKKEKAVKAEKKAAAAAIDASIQEYIKKYYPKLTKYSKGYNIEDYISGLNFATTLIKDGFDLFNGRF